MPSRPRFGSHVRHPRVSRDPTHKCRILWTQVSPFYRACAPLTFLLTRCREFSAHASAAPWEGINALDAAVLAYTSISALRQQIKPTHRVHGIIEGRNWASNGTYLCQRQRVCNFILRVMGPPIPLLLLTQNSMPVIPDYAKMSYMVRAPTEGEVTDLLKRIITCFE